MQQENQPQNQPKPQNQKPQRSLLDKARAAMKDLIAKRGLQSDRKNLGLKP